MLLAFKNGNSKRSRYELRSRRIQDVERVNIYVDIRWSKYVYTHYISTSMSVTKEKGT